ncbi:MAG: quinone-dependent dihydroorotate dehydrogenase [Rudaea sp.]
MYGLIRPLLFRLDPEQAHAVTLRLIGLAGRLPPARALLQTLYRVQDPVLEVEAFGLRFRNPVGLAAGYDKDAAAVLGLGTLGFGHIEVGTVTLLPQAGNPRPRVRRVPAAGALVNSMGFPNAGVGALRVPRVGPHIGINIGKGKDTPLEEAARDYCELYGHVYKQADYVALNVSSPNTLGLRQLQARDAIEGLLRQVTALRDLNRPRVPVLVKIAPDLEWSQVDDVLTAVSASRVDGIVATNTTIAREGLPEWARSLNGGLSGQPLKARSTEIIRYIARQTRGALPIIGVGGVSSGADAIEKLRAGASLVQVYTGLVYRGPGLVREINAYLVEECRRRGAATVRELGERL